MGDRAVKLREVKGNVEALGFPANKLRRPGVDSRGRRLRTQGIICIILYLYELITHWDSAIFLSQRSIRRIGKSWLVEAWATP